LYVKSHVYRSISYLSGTVDISWSRKCVFRKRI